jgi:hypothetical protein
MKYDIYLVFMKLFIYYDLYLLAFIDLLPTIFHMDLAYNLENIFTCFQESCCAFFCDTYSYLINYQYTQ